MFGYYEEALASRPDRELTGALTHLHGGANEWGMAWAGGRQTVEDTVIGDVAIPAHPPFLAGEAFPGPARGQSTQALLGPTHPRRDPCGGMRLSIEPLAPGQYLLVEIVEVGEAHTGPEARLQYADGALDLAFGLGRVGAADARRDAQTRHKVAKGGVPLCRSVLDAHQDALHAIRQHRTRRAPEILKSRHETAEERGRIGALRETRKAHP